MKSHLFVLTLFMLLAFCDRASTQTGNDARKLFEATKAEAEKGDPTAQNNLGNYYYEGTGVAKDTVEAVKWYRKAADQGYAVAQSNLGGCYGRGLGVDQDFATALEYFHKAAAQGNAQGQFNIGLSYVNGRGVATNLTEAVKWYRKAADQGYAAAQSNLGFHYEYGNGVEKDCIKAGAYYRLAAEQGYARAQYNLHSLYAKGDGVIKDYVEAYKWLNLAAAAQGFELARNDLLYLERLMTAEQIAEGQRKARMFRPTTGRETGRADSRGESLETQPSGTGTGFFITADGFLITSEHAVREAQQIRLITSTGMVAARIAKVDAANDLVLLKAEGRHVALPVTSSRSVKLGSTVATVGFPNTGLQGFAPKLAKGEIASLSGAQDDARYFQISVPVQPGNSGGALVDERVNVVGVVSAKLSTQAALTTSGTLPENVNYAVKSSFLLSFLESVPEVLAKLKQPNAKEMKFEEVVKAAEQAAVLVLVY